MDLAPDMLPKSPDGGTRSADPLSLAVWLLIAAMPLLFALASWNTVDRGAGWQILSRYLSLPVLTVEAIVIAVAFADGFEPVRALRATPGMRAALGAMLAIALGTSLFVAPDPFFAMIRTCSTVTHLLFGLSVVRLMQTRWAALRPLIWPSVIAGACVYVLVVALFVASIAEPAAFDWKYFGLAVIHVRQIGFYAAIGAAAAIGLAAGSHSMDRRYWLWTGAAALLFGLAFWSGTRSVPVAVAAAFGAVALLVPELRSRAATLSLFASLAAGALLSLAHSAPSPLFGLWRMSQSLAGQSAEEISSGRMSMWAGTWRFALERPFFGWGEGQFQQLVPEAVGEYNHPHNVLLQLFLQWGLAGTMCCLILAAGLASRIARAVRAAPAESAPALMVLFTLLIYGLFEGTFYHPYPLAMLALSLAFLLTMPQFSPASPAPLASSEIATATGHLQ